MVQQYGQPIFILPEGALRTTGRDAQRNNILAAKQVAETVRTTLGPKGMDKMLVNDLGDIVITNDGATIVEELNVEHPAAKMMVEVAKTQDEEVGDGTTTAVVLAGELLKEAENLMDQGIHTSIICRGYRMAAEKSYEILKTMANGVSINDTEILKKIAITAMTGKNAERGREDLADLSIRAIKQIAEKENDKIKVDTDNIKIEKKTGGSVSESEIINGVILDKERAHDAMPKSVKNAKIALINAALEIKKTETDAKIKITSPEQLEGFLKQEEDMVRGMVDKIKESKANVLFCQKGVDDLALHYLSGAGIFAVKQVKESDMDKLAKATGGKIVTNIKDLNQGDLGEAKLVEEEKIAGDEMVFVRECKNPKAVSILIRGGTEHVISEVERAVNDAIRGVASAVEDGKIVAGGGAPEVEVAKELRRYSDKVGGREQLAINAFADAIEIIPRTLAESAGMDAIDTLVELRTSHEKNKNIGLDVFKCKCVDMWNDGVIETMKIKTQAIKSASEAADMILRIDDVIASSKKSMPSMPPGGMGGMPEY